MNIAEIAQQRYTTKAFDNSKRIADTDMAQLETLLRMSPSSTNSQPWHFVIAATEAGKKCIAQATTGVYGFNEAKVLNASHVVVLCARVAIDDDYLNTLLAQEDADGRFANEDVRNDQHRGRSFFVNAHRNELGDAQHWMAKQVYLALGTLLLGAATLGIDACPIEGFDQKVLDETLGLVDKGVTSTVIVALGYRSADDFNAKLPKSRLPEAQVITRI